MKRSTLLERLINEPYECYYHKNGVENDYDGSLQNLYLIVENPTTKIRDITFQGCDGLAVELLAHSIDTTIILKFCSSLS